MPKGDPFDSLIKFRCHKDLSARTLRLAKEAKRIPTDWLRIAMEEYVRLQEKELGLSPITSKEIELYLGKTLSVPQRERLLPKQN